MGLIEPWNVISRARIVCFIAPNFPRAETLKLFVQVEHHGRIREGSRQTRGLGMHSNDADGVGKTVAGRIRLHILVP